MYNIICMLYINIYNILVWLCNCYYVVKQCENTTILVILLFITCNLAHELFMSFNDHLNRTVQCTL